MISNRNSRQRLWVNSFRIFIFLFFVSLVLTAQAAYAQKIATLQGVKGDVRVFKPGKTRELKGRNGMALFQRSLIRTTNDDSFANIIYNKGGKVAMTPRSELTLTSADFSKGKMRVKIDLITGKIFNIVDKLTEGGSFEVRTPTSTSGVKGTVYSAETTALISVFMVKEGSLSATNRAGARKTVIVGSLMKTTVEKGKPPTDPVPLTPEEIAMFDFLDDWFKGDKSDRSAKLTRDKVKTSFEKFVDQRQLEKLPPSKIASRVNNLMTLLIKTAADRGFTLKQITALVKAAAKGAIDGCHSRPPGYDFTFVNNASGGQCTSRPESPLGVCAITVLELVEGAKAGAARIGMTQSHVNRLVNAIGAASGGCVKAKTQMVELTQEEKDAIKEARDAARQVTHNIASPTL